jgi:Gas vesicle synthesis protein GvpL/GvpF
VTAEGRCVWLYAVTANGAAAVTGSPAGVGGEPVRVVRTAGLTAFVGHVDVLEFGAAALRRNLEELAWLDRTVRAHHAVIEAIAEGCPVVPMRLATIYATDEGVAEMMRQRATDLRWALSQIRARSEWGVKAFAAQPTDPGLPCGPGRATGPGAAYLQRRRAQLAANESGRRAATAGAQAVHTELCRLSAAARLYPPQSPDLARQPARMVLNGAYLVANERAGEFAAAIADLTATYRSVRLAVTGPWPAYSFVGGHEAGGQP